jgi:hypothetical protein
VSGPKGLKKSDVACFNSTLTHVKEKITIGYMHAIQVLDESLLLHQLSQKPNKPKTL